jgi:hypothetical protein
LAKDKENLQAQAAPRRQSQLYPETDLEISAAA